MAFVSARALLLRVLGFVLCGRAQIRIVAPQWLAKRFSPTKGRIDGSTATFGAPFYGERIMGRLVWGDSTTNHTHCIAEDYDVPRPDVSASGWSTDLIHVVMVRRGGCSFTRKVAVAVGKGAHAVIIVDKEDSGLTEREILNTILGDDGYGSSIDVPSLLISSRDGEPLIDAVKRSQVVVELAWDVPTNHVVVLDVWMNSASAESLQFLTDFAPMRRELNEALSFVPHYYVFSMRASVDYVDLCWDQSSEFCTRDPDGSGRVTGRMVLEENVRQLCIHELTKKTGSDFEMDESGKPILVEYSVEFWDYVARLRDSCPLHAEAEAQRFGLECSRRLMRLVGIDHERVERCAASSATEKLRRELMSTAWSPDAVRINGWRYSGALDAGLVTRAICAGFRRRPQECETLAAPRGVDGILRGRQAEDAPVGLGTLAASLASLGVALACAILLWRRYYTKVIRGALREEVMLEVRSQLDAYSQLPS